jgi:hypothetical protein
MSATRNKKNADQGPSRNADASRPRKSSTRPDEMSAEVIEFITAIDEYKRINQRPFPSWSEVLEILKGLGYERGDLGG